MNQPVNLPRSVPGGFESYPLPPGFLMHCTAVYLHTEKPVLGLFVGAHHLNSVQIAHGGFLATIADSALGIVLKRQLNLKAPPVTVNLNLDYIGAVREGDWLEAEIEVHKPGKRITNASCLLKVNGRLVLRCSGIFMMGSSLSPS